MERKNNNRIVDDKFEIFGSHARFFMLIYITVCLTSIWSNILTFNIAVLCMFPHRISNKTISADVIERAKISETLNVSISVDGDENIMESSPTQIKEVVWYTTQEKSFLISAVAIGSIIGHFPALFLIDRFGIRKIFGALGILSAISTICIPIAVRLGIYHFSALRVLQGFAFAANFAVVGVFLHNWTYVKQNGLFLSIMMAFFQLSPSITNPISGYICANYEWPLIYYGHGIFSLIIFSLFVIVYRNSANKHPLVGEIEFQKIKTGKVAISRSRKQELPILQILTTKSVWAIWICALAYFLFENVMFFYIPTYLNTVAAFEVSESGITAAVPPFAHFVTKIVCGWASDKLQFIPDNTKVKIFNTIAFVGCSVCLIALTCVEAASNTRLCFILLSVSNGFFGFIPGGFLKCSALISNVFATFITGNISLAISLMMLFIPAFMSYIAADNTEKQWNAVFLTSAIVLIMANLIFIAFASTSPPPWASIAPAEADTQMNVRVITIGDERKRT